jgi:ABC-type molybdate transport system substrate-binding protein
MSESAEGRDQSRFCSCEDLGWPASTARPRLDKLGVWSSVSDSIAQAEYVRAALHVVSRGEAPAGIVYQTGQTDAAPLSRAS